MNGSFRLLWLWATVAAVAPSRAEAQSNRKPIVAVFDIEDKGVGLKRNLCSRLSDYMSMTLAATGRYQVVPRDQLKKRLVKQKRTSYKQCYDQTCQIEIGKELAAQKSLTTMVMKLGSKCMVTTVLYDLKKSASEGGASAEGGCSEDGIVHSIKTVVKRLVGDKRIKISAALRKPPKLRRSKKRRAKRLTGYGGLLIKSVPTGGEVWLDGVKAKGVTPLTVSDLTVGGHLLQIKKGVYRYTGRANVVPDKFTTTSVALRKATVRLEILSTPPEATITLNGRIMGKSPMILPSLPAGKHMLSLRKRGFITSREKLRIGATPKMKVRITLKPSGFIVVRTTPPGATVLVGGKSAGRTPLRFPAEQDKCKVRLIMAGRKSAMFEVEVEPGKDTEVTAKMELTEQEKIRRSSPPYWHHTHVAQGGFVGRFMVGPLYELDKGRVGYTIAAGIGYQFRIMQRFGLAPEVWLSYSNWYRRALSVAPGVRFSVYLGRIDIWAAVHFGYEHLRETQSKLHFGTGANYMFNKYFGAGLGIGSNMHIDDDFDDVDDYSFHFGANVLGRIPM